MLAGPIPPPRDSHTSFAVGDRMVMFGGDGAQNYMDDLWLLDPEANHWTQLQVRDVRL